jgi:hypothetical protein
METIEHAKQYAIDKKGNVIRDGKQLRREYRCGKWYSQVTDDDGKRKRICIDKLANPKPSISTGFIFDHEGAKTHPLYPTIAVTKYGAVYCVQKPSRGAAAGSCYMVSEFVRTSGWRYVSVRKTDGSRRTIRVAKLVKDVWGSDSCFSENE